jgi:hypothetical protein
VGKWPLQTWGCVLYSQCDRRRFLRCPDSSRVALFGTFGGRVSVHPGVSGVGTQRTNSPSTGFCSCPANGSGRSQTTRPGATSFRSRCRPETLSREDCEVAEPTRISRPSRGPCCDARPHSADRLLALVAALGYSPRPNNGLECPYARKAKSVPMRMRKKVEPHVRGSGHEQDAEMQMRENRRCPQWRHLRHG